MEYSAMKMVCTGTEGLVGVVGVVGVVRVPF